LTSVNAAALPRANHGSVRQGPLAMNSRNLLPRAKRGWMLAGIVVPAAILPAGTAGRRKAPAV